ncbi:ATP-binding protein [Radiobacillus sp. PE A8.2]|uniref:ATP-binding protein n=1 Tax=Radiobacillus sp. PE A8.2 TaxID=3380349 RepID=UPI00388E7E1E
MINSLSSNLELKNIGMTYRVIKKDENFIHTFCEGRLLYRLGFTPGDIINQTLFDIYPTDVAKSKSVFYEKAWKGQYIQYETKVEDIHYIGYLNPIFDGDKVVELICFCVDITEVKILERRVVKQENLYRDVLENLSEGVLIVKSGKIVSLNDTAKKLLGIDTGFFNEYFYNKLNHKFIREDGALIHYSDLPGVKTQKDGISFSDFVCGVKYNNNITWISVNSKPLELHGEDENGALLTIHDITHKKLQETKLHESYRLQNALINKLDKGIIVTDKHIKIIMMNQKFYEMFELNEYLEMYIGENASDIHYLFDEAKAESISKLKKEINIGKDTILQFNYSLFNNGSDFELILWEFEDVTDSKLMEMALVGTKEEAERANSRKSEFLTKMSHELRTPLNSILGFAQVLERDETLNEIQQDSVQEILKGGYHLLNIVNDVLDLSRIEIGKIQILIEKVNFLTVLQECISIVTPLANKKNITILNNTVQYKHLLVLVDPVRLKQIIINLLDNAIKYNKNGGEVIISAYNKNNKINIHIVDTGIGFSELEASKIFDPFYRIKGEMEAGTGIGLSLVKQLVNLMGGEVTVKSIKGRGSNFSFSIPIHQEYIGEIGGSDKFESQVNIYKNNSMYKILYIEDNQANIKLVQSIFQTTPNYSLLTSFNGKDGLDNLIKEKVDLILLDLNLPDMSGYEVIEVIKRHPKIRNIPVIALSANAMPSEIQSAINNGFDDYIIKPINVSEFLTKLRELLANQVNKEKSK